MDDDDRIENARAAEEARTAVIGRRGGSRSKAAEETLRRHVASESSREHCRERQDLEPAATGNEEVEK